MKFFGADILYMALLLASSVDASSADISKRSLTFDKSCNTKYGKLTAKQLIDKSIDFQPKLAKAGVDGLNTVIELLEYQMTGTKEPAASKDDLDRIIATYRVLFGDIDVKTDDATPDPDSEKEMKDHIAAIKITRDSLKKMAKPGKPDLIVHCNDDWLSEKAPKNAVAKKPTTPPRTGYQYFYDMDRKAWTTAKGGKPCQSGKASFTSMNKKLKTGGREKGPERVTFCKDYLKRQNQLESDKQPHIWDISKTKLPATFTTYTTAGKKDKTLPFHISSFGKKMGAKWFHQLMHTELFHSGPKGFVDSKVPDTEGGTGGVAYGFNGAVGLAKQNGGKNIAESSRNIETILYWSLAMYYDKWVWSTGNPEDPSTLSAAPSDDGTADGEFRVETAAKKGGSKKPAKPVKPADPPKTEKPAEPPKTEAPPKTEKPADPPKTSAAAAPPPASSKAPPAPPASQPAPPASATKTKSASSTQLPSMSTPLSSKSSSGTASATRSIQPSCSNTLCKLPSSSASPTSSSTVPEQTFEYEPMNAGSMTADQITAIAGVVAAEQVAVMALWDQVFGDMTLPTGTIGGDPSASLGTGLPMATGGLGGLRNGTWTMPILKARQRSRERRMYDFAS